MISMSLLKKNSDDVVSSFSFLLPYFCGAAVTAPYCLLKYTLKGYFTGSALQMFVFLTTGSVYASAYRPNQSITALLLV